jgi:hypothetical protein
MDGVVVSAAANLYVRSTGRPWSRLDKLAFRTALQSSALCCPDRWSALDVDDLALLDDAEIAAILDRQLPVSVVTARRPRGSMTNVAWLGGVFASWSERLVDRTRLMLSSRLRLRRLGLRVDASIV